MSSSSVRPILVVEDQDADYETVMRRLKKLSIEAPVHRCLGVDEVHDHLGRWKAGIAAMPMPALLVLDLKLPDGDGQELLVRMKSDESFKDIPVVVWSAVNDPAVQERCLKVGASEFRAKAADNTITDAAIDHMVHLWRQSTVL
ncbi:CheY-like chemotaxis protein [Roseimicrobium gellanilyticum]|uniref:CheY-like chemotaxis protein n=1 Tax=Roseimicrobium gellanilyticum TaxID=748857 RepID=A0A366HII0_9BACT|nr:response regulator [Roseimicrobium gellanilyticum]RBP41409.1 CheY-like chemotaxis protein [Roseimicrobium gellanilyticum]